VPRTLRSTRRRRNDGHPMKPVCGHPADSPSAAESSKSNFQRSRRRGWWSAVGLGARRWWSGGCAIYGVYGFYGAYGIFVRNPRNFRIQEPGVGIQGDVNDFGFSIFDFGLAITGVGLGARRWWSSVCSIYAIFAKFAKFAIFVRNPRDLMFFGIEGLGSRVVPGCVLGIARRAGRGC